MKRRLLFALLASLLGGAASNAILFAAESQVWRGTGYCGCAHSPGDANANVGSANRN